MGNDDPPVERGREREVAPRSISTHNRKRISVDDGSFDIGLRSGNDIVFRVDIFLEVRDFDCCEFGDVFVCRDCRSAGHLRPRNRESFRVPAVYRRPGTRRLRHLEERRSHVRHGTLQENDTRSVALVLPRSSESADFSRRICRLRLRARPQRNRICRNPKRLHGINGSDYIRHDRRLRRQCSKPIRLDVNGAIRRRIEKSEKRNEKNAQNTVS